MIKLVAVQPAGAASLRLTFSDGSHGDYDLTEVIARDTELVRPLRDQAYLGACYLELGALCWPNGLAFSAGSLQRKLAEQGRLERPAAA